MNDKEEILLKNNLSYIIRDYFPPSIFAILLSFFGILIFVLTSTANINWDFESIAFFLFFGGYFILFIQAIVAFVSSIIWKLMKKTKINVGIYIISVPIFSTALYALIWVSLIFLLMALSIAIRGH